MVKFESADDPGFSKVVGELRRLVRDLNAQGTGGNRNPITQATTPGEQRTIGARNDAPYRVQLSGNQTFNGPTNFGGNQTIYGSVDEADDK
jgi:hypothetical protein